MAIKPHIDRHFDDELRELRGRVLEMGGFVEKQIADAVRVLENRNAREAEKVIERDQVVNQMDVEIEEMCLRMLALHQPAARDLRFITTAMKINADLERAGDMAQNICERAMELSREPQLKPYVDVPRMARMTQEMLQDCLDAFVREDCDLALSVCRADAAVDALLQQIFRELISYMVEDPATISRAMRIIFISKYLERVADHATNIAEMVVFLVKGKSIRHMDEPPTEV